MLKEVEGGRGLKKESWLEREGDGKTFVKGGSKVLPENPHAPPKDTLLPSCTLPRYVSHRPHSIPFLRGIDGFCSLKRSEPRTRVRGP